jgi:hypothetical protein
MAVTHDEGSGGGAISVLAWAVVSALLVGWVVVTGFSGRKHVEHTAPQTNTEAPAATDSKNP